jgi:beta-phosphoglucomutase-like phosphatase (HAD superfamily)
MPSLQAVIFDLDGTLVDTEAVWTEGLRRWLASHGKTYEPAIQHKMMGIPAAVNVKFLAERYGLEVPMEQLLDERVRFFEGALKDLGFVEKPGACALVRKIQAAGIKVGLATSADREYAERALKAIVCHDCFTALTCGTEIVHGKPAPDIYLLAAKKLGVEPVSCLAVEDAPSGVASASAAGMKVVGVADPRYVDALSGATLEVRSLETLTVERCVQLFS